MKKVENQLKKILKVLGQVIVMEGRKNLKKDNINASYTLINSLKYEVRSVGKTDLDLELRFTMVDYGINVIFGRGKNKTPPPIAPIIDWLKSKNLVREFLGIKGNVNVNNPAYESQLKYLAGKISKKIGENGKPARNFLLPVKVKFIGTKYKFVLPKDYINKIIKIYKEETKEVVTDEVMEILKKMQT